MIYHLTQNYQSDWESFHIKKDNSTNTENMIWCEADKLEDLKALGLKIKKVIYRHYEEKGLKKPSWMDATWLNSIRVN